MILTLILTQILTLSYPYSTLNLTSTLSLIQTPILTLTLTLNLTLILSEYQTFFEFRLENSKITLRFKEPSNRTEKSPFETKDLSLFQWKSAHAPKKELPKDFL